MKATVLHTFRKFKDANLHVKAQRVHDALGDIVPWPADLKTRADFQADIDAYGAALVVIQAGGRVEVAIKKKLRRAVEADLMLYADYVNAQAGGDPAYILHYGFDPSATVHSKVVLAAPCLKGVVHLASTQFKLRVGVVAGAHGYEAQVRVANGPWSTVGVFSSTRHMVLKELVSGLNYQIRLRALAGANNYSEWSDVASSYCT